MNSYGEIYLYRTRKPWWSLIFSRHHAYVGQTRAPGIRHLEHITGAGRWGVREPQPWSDLAPTRHVLFKSANVSDRMLNLIEWLAIKLLCPVYNVSMNKGNPRRIKPYVARAHRLARDRGVRYVWTVRPVHALTVAALVLGVLAVTR